MRLFGTLLVVCMMACVSMALALPANAADPVLAAVKKRGQLVCGVNGEVPGFSTLNDKKEWSGFEIDFCRAIAAAVLGDANKVKFVPVTLKDRFDLLRAGNIDVLFRNTILTLERTVKTGVRDAAIYYFDGQAVAVPKKLGVSALNQISGRNICILNGSPYGRNIRDWFGYRSLTYTAVTFDAQKEMYEAFYDGKCDAVTQQISAVTTTIISSGKAADYLVLPEILSNNPIAAWVRAGDDEWYDVVRWTFSALFDSEERGITQANVDSQRQTGMPATKRLLGSSSDDGKLLSLGDNWAYDAVKQVGNYGEIFERNLGQGSPWKFSRGVNALWTSGGMMHALPLR